MKKHKTENTNPPTGGQTKHKKTQREICVLNFESCVLFGFCDLRFVFYLK